MCVHVGTFIVSVFLATAMPLYQTHKARCQGAPVAALRMGCPWTDDPSDDRKKFINWSRDSGLYLQTPQLLRPSVIIFYFLSYTGAASDTKKLLKLG